MKKSNLIDQLSERTPLLTRKDVEASVNLILENIALTLKGGGRVEIRGFGTFQLSHRLPRTGRNPMTGEAVEVPAKSAPHFRAGKELRERINKR